MRSAGRLLFFVFAVFGASPLAAGAPQAGPLSAAPAGPRVAPQASQSAPAAGSNLDAEAREPATDVKIAPAPNGAIGAWLVAGPYRGKSVDASPVGFDEKAMAPSFGAAAGTSGDLGNGKPRPPAKWRIVSSSDGPIDLKAALDAADLPDLVAYAAGKLHIAKSGKYLLLLGVDDGVRVSIDGRTVFTRDTARPVRDDDDVLPLDLAAGDHDLVLKFHQREGAWAFRARLTDPKLGSAIGAYLALPGTSANDARDLAAKMSWVSLDRIFDTTLSPPAYRPQLKIRFPEGAPRGVPLAIHTRLVIGAGAAYELDAGGVPVSAEGASELTISLPKTAPWSGTAILETTVAGRTLTTPILARPLAEQALVTADRALAKTKADEAWLKPGSLVSVRFLRQRLAQLVTRGDTDVEAQDEEARELERLASTLERGVDPYDGRTGAMRRAILSPFDGQPNELGLYVPPSYKAGATRKYPLVVGLHGMNSYAMSMMRAIFGFDEPKKDAFYKDRHPVPLPAIDAFVVTPYAHGNTMYRELGEDDVLQVVEWAKSAFPIDETRITISGPSMGGIGSAGVPLHTPHVFAAAAPLCGYHDYFIRPDVGGVPQRPWDKLLVEERSNVSWAENGEHLPLWIVHGTKDLPVKNSDVLIERYEKLGYSIRHDHPELGHNVWSWMYDDLKGMKWLLSQRLDRHPSHVHFKTARTRYGKSAWVNVDELATENNWGEVDARIRSKTRITMTTTGIVALTLTRDPQLLDSGAIEITVDGKTLRFAEGEALAIHKESAWEKGARVHDRVTKLGRVTGPIRDVFHEPILFVYGTADDEGRANELVARSFAQIRGGINVAYPVISDAEFFARGEALANDRALFLVGRSNRVLAALDAAGPAPLTVGPGVVTVGSERFTGRELGAAFIRPNPARPDRYVVVVAGADVPGTLRALSLPDVLPDFVVWDEGVAPSRWQIVTGRGALRAGGFFKKDWSLPSVVADPQIKRGRSVP